MLALRKTEVDERLGLFEVPEPAPAAGDVVVEVRAAGICGSDLHIDHGSPSYRFVYDRLPLTLGHELAGVVIATAPDVTDLGPGDRVVIRPSVACGRCPACLADDEDGCTNRMGIGMTREGGFAARVVAPARNCIVMPDGLSFETAALTEPLTVAFQAVRRAAILPGERVLVLGPGPIGLGIALMARTTGATVSLRGRDDGPRLALARALGIDDAVEGGIDGPFDVVFDASGSGEAVALGLGLLRQGGRLVLAGLYGPEFRIDADLVVRRQVDVLGSHRAPVSAWLVVLAMIAQWPDRFARMVTHRVRLADAGEGFALAERREATKVMLLPGGPEGEIIAGSTG
jgi:2-desacetyl-2-hydroxyethyl bacteriochlorophyllide A dehydrogenase